MDGNSFLNACKNGDVDTVKSKIRSVERNQKDKFGWSGMFYAINFHQTDVVSFLASQVLQINDQDHDGWTPLMYAAKLNFMDLVKLLLYYKCKLNMRNNEGYTALLIAIEFNNEDIACELIHSGAKINIADFNKCSPFMHACSLGQFSVVKALIDHSTKLNDKDAQHKTALMYAVNNEHTEVVDLLLSQHGIDLAVVTRSKMNVLMIAAAKGNIYIVKKLIDHLGPETLKVINSVDIIKQNSLFYAIKGGNLEIVKLLCEKGADVNLTSKMHETPLLFAVRLHKTDVVSFFLKEYQNHINKLQCDNLGRTTLHLACNYGFKDIIEICEEVGIPNDVKDYTSEERVSGITPLYYANSVELLNYLLSKGYRYLAPHPDYILEINQAARFGHLEVVQYLLENHYHEKMFDKTKTPLMYACQYGKTETATYLIRFGFDLNQTYGKETALRLAAKHGEYECANLLIKRGADLNKNSPLKAAIKYQHLEIVKLLIWKGAYYLEPAKSSKEIFDFLHDYRDQMML